MLSDHHANFAVSDVTRGGARSFLRFYSMGRAGWGKKFWCQNFSLIILHPAIGAFFLVFPVLGHSGHSTMCQEMCKGNWLVFGVGPFGGWRVPGVECGGRGPTLRGTYAYTQKHPRAIKVGPF